MTDDPISGVHVHRVLLDQLLNKWSVAVLELLCERPCRFNELRRGAPGVMQKSLVATLRRLERNGVVARRVVDARPVAVEYSITALGKTLRGPIDALLGWVEDHAEDIRTARSSFDAVDRAGSGSRLEPGGGHSMSAGESATTGVAPVDHLDRAVAGRRRRLGPPATSPSSPRARSTRADPVRAGRGPARSPELGGRRG